jgi:CheY-like chemotaxis protein
VSKPASDHFAVAGRLKQESVLMVHGIIRGYDGFIEVDSTPGSGTRFDVYIPVVGETASVKEHMTSELPGGRERILLVDDEPMLMEVIGDMLTMLGYRVLATTSSTEALARFQEKPTNFDLVITDMNMPDLSGDRLASAIKSIRPDIGVILCSGYNRRLAEQGPESLGVDAAIIKPVSQSDLAQVVRKVLDRRRKLEVPVEGAAT